MSEDKEALEAAFFQDPVGFLARATASVKKEVTEELTGAYTREKRHNEYWDGFHGERPDLKGHNAEVREILGRHEDSWAKEGITIGESYDRLGREVDEALTVRDARKRAGSMSVTDMDGNHHTMGGQTQVKVRGKTMLVGKDGSLSPTMGQSILDRQAKFMNPRAPKKEDK